MSGDLGPRVVVRAMARMARRVPAVHFIVHGDDATLRRTVRRQRHLKGRCEIVHAPDVVSMNSRPSH
ncbi:MAG: phosphate acyltransferase, partial [Rhodobacteraceae bacterium]|nr:phosphate acyltransferase [Paracoccaceae bacterium]